MRYQRALKHGWKLSAAIEKLRFLGIQNANALPGKFTTQWRLLAVRADHRGGPLMMGASVGQFNWEGAFGGGWDSTVQLASEIVSRQNLTKRAYTTWHLSHSEGAGENIMALVGTGANAMLDSNGDLEIFSAFAAVLGVDYDWIPTLSSNFSNAYAYGWLDTPDMRYSLAMKRGGIGHANPIWKSNIGLFSEDALLMYGKTRVRNDATGDASWLQFMAKFEF